MRRHFTFSSGTLRPRGDQNCAEIPSLSGVNYFLASLGGWKCIYWNKIRTRIAITFWLIIIVASPPQEQLMVYWNWPNFSSRDPELATHIRSNNHRSINNFLSFFQGPKTQRPWIWYYLVNCIPAWGFSMTQSSSNFLRSARWDCLLYRCGLDRT